MRARLDGMGTRLGGSAAATFPLKRTGPILFDHMTHPMSTAVSHQTITLRGSLVTHKVLTADGWGRGDLDVAGQTFVVPVTGKFLNVRVGDSVECVGYWQDTKYGRQFKCTACTPGTPDTSEGIVLWLASRLPDVGVTRARALVATFGTGLWKIIEADPAQLTQVNGITPERAQAIADAYASVAHEREHMVRLRGWGLTDNQVKHCLEAWGDLAVVVERIRADPYELANVVDGFGFKRADRVAMAMGFAKDAPARIRAGILYVLDMGAQNEGHCFLWGGKLREVAAVLLEVQPAIVVTQIFAVCEMRRVVRRGARIYSAVIDRDEHACAVAIKQLLRVQVVA